MKEAGQGADREGRRARACVRRATEFDPLRRIEALPGRLLPPHPTVPRTVGLRTSCPRTTARGLHRPQIRLSKGRGLGSAQLRAATLAPPGATGGRSLAVAPRQQPGGGVVAAWLTRHGRLRRCRWLGCSRQRALPSGRDQQASNLSLNGGFCHFMPSVALWNGLEAPYAKHEHIPA